MDQILISLAQTPEYIVALVSVLVTGTVALVPLLIDGRKAKREGKLRLQERQAADTTVIRQAALDLLGYLAHFRNKDYSTIARAVGSEHSVERLTSDLLRHYYAWETLVWPRLNIVTFERVFRLRETFEEMEIPTPSGTVQNGLAANYSDLSDTILAITDDVTRQSE